MVMSISGGMADLRAIQRTFEERLTFMITSEQKCFTKMARHMSADEAQEMADLATNPFFIYARISGSNQALGKLQQQPTVRGVILNLRPASFLILNRQNVTLVRCPTAKRCRDFTVRNVCFWPLAAVQNGLFRLHQTTAFHPTAAIGLELV
jgi:hypothetical protein